MRRPGAGGGYLSPHSGGGAGAAAGTTLWGRRNKKAPQAMAQEVAQATGGERVLT